MFPVYPELHVHLFGLVQLPLRHPGLQIAEKYLIENVKIVKCEFFKGYPIDAF